MQAKKIFDKLTGGTVTDKAYLVDMITKYGRSEKDSEEVKKLGLKLYQILLDGGLNEKQEINKDRLLEKADNYIYAERYKDAIEVLKVLESLEDWKLVKDKFPIYYFNNEIEVKKFSYLNPNLDFIWKPSIKNEILTLLANAEINLKKIKEAKETLNFYKKINPVSLSSFMIEAKLEKEKNLEKFKNILLDAFNYAYTQTQFANIYKELSYYYEKKSEYEVSYCLLRAAVSFSDSLEIEIAQKKLFEKFKDLGIKLPTMTGEEVGQKLLSLNIPIKITEDMFTALCEGYVSYLESGYANAETKVYFRDLITSVTGEDSFVYELEESVNSNSKSQDDKKSDVETKNDDSEEKFIEVKNKKLEKKNVASINKTYTKKTSDKGGKK